MAARVPGRRGPPVLVDAAANPRHEHARSAVPRHHPTDHERFGKPRLMDIKELNRKDVDELIRVGGDLEVAGADGLAKEELVERIIQRQGERGGQQYVAGVLDIVDDGYGFMRRRGLMPSPDDIYVSSSHVRRFGLRSGDRVAGVPRPPKERREVLGPRARRHGQRR